ncbi:hypothetical protein CORC01_13272 [Colletotrichum orchidophilum]|uniref:NmrA-like domain-containing protein n=1 Tax=Colletotrichum orchidophilum TaxID=1209926 RepID=A0A1G4AQT4_9PEZI|nr:uncharacterized protein CORC01_13272 [Colletotrichum orchidophilum]OHE91453.1 hypothetical protein CORC01_13272 [Colletotrichum orchidophilum]
MASPFKNIVMIGASGSIGTVILQALLNAPSITITIVQRISSTTTGTSTATSLPPSTRLITIPDTYPDSSLVAAFAGQDAVINCMTTLAVNTQLRIISAAVKAHVRRYIPSEFGLNNNNLDARSLCSVFREKGEVQDFLRSLEHRMEWMSIACGMWIRWSAKHDFLGMHISTKKFVFWDDGQGWFSATTEENTALALVNALTQKWEETANKVVWLSDFALTQRMLLDAIENVTGDRFDTEVVNSETLIREKKLAVAAGDTAAIYTLIETGFVTGRFGGHLEKEGQIMNDLLGLPKVSLEKVVKQAVEAVLK